MNKKGVFGTKCSRCPRKRVHGTYCKPCRAAYVRDRRRGAKASKDLRKPQRRTQPLTDQELDECARRGLRFLLGAA